MIEEGLNLVYSLTQEVKEAQSEFSDDELEYMFSILERATKALESKKEAQPVPVPEVPDSPIESSNVNGFLYDPKNKRMLVQFHGPYPQAKGSIYSYEGISPLMAQVLKVGGLPPKTSGKNAYHSWIKGRSPSLGGSVWRILRDTKVPYRKVA